MKKKKDKKHSSLPQLSSWEEFAFFTLSALCIVGIFYSNALVTISLAGIMILSLKHLSIKKMQDFLKDRSLLPFLFLFLLVFLSGGNSENQEDWVTGVRIKLPFLLLPLAYFALPSIKSRIIIDIHYWLLAVCAIVGFPVLFYALFHYEEMLQLISKGQYIPTPIEHVKYSMFNAYAVITGMILLLYDHQLNSRSTKVITIISTVFVAVVMHILAVRTGLVILYGSILILGIYYAIQRGSKSLLACIFFGVLIIPIILYQTVPTLKQKIGYTIYDWKEFRGNGGAHFSDSERMMSYEAGWAVWKDHPVMGVGYGDIKTEVNEYYAREFGRIDLLKLPHSQFLLTLGATGLLGLVLLLSGFYLPFFIASGTSISRLLLIFLYLNYSLSFLVENSLERSISVAFFVVLAMPLIKVIMDEKSDLHRIRN